MPECRKGGRTLGGIEHTGKTNKQHYAYRRLNKHHVKSRSRVKAFEDASTQLVNELVHDSQVRLSELPISKPIRLLVRDPPVLLLHSQAGTRRPKTVRMESTGERPVVSVPTASQPQPTSSNPVGAPSVIVKSGEQPPPAAAIVSTSNLIATTPPCVAASPATAGPGPVQQVRQPLPQHIPLDVPSKPTALAATYQPTVIPDPSQPVSSNGNRNGGALPVGQPTMPEIPNQPVNNGTAHPHPNISQRVVQPEPTLVYQTLPPLGIVGPSNPPPGTPASTQCDNQIMGSRCEIVDSTMVSTPQLSVLPAIAPEGATVIGMVGNTPIVRLPESSRVVKKKRGRFTLIAEAPITTSQPEIRNGNITGYGDISINSNNPAPAPINNSAAPFVNPAPETIASTMEPAPNSNTAPANNPQTFDGTGDPVVKRKGRFYVTNLKDPGLIAVGVNPQMTVSAVPIQTYRLTPGPGQSESLQPTVMVATPSQQSEGQDQVLLTSTIAGVQQWSISEYSMPNPPPGEHWVVDTTAIKASSSISAPGMVQPPTQSSQTVRSSGLVRNPSQDSTLGQPPQTDTVSTPFVVVTTASSSGPASGPPAAGTQRISPNNSGTFKPDELKEKAEQPSSVQNTRPKYTTSAGRTGLAGQTGLGKVFHYLDQMRLEVTEADRTIKTLQADIRLLKERNKELEAKARDAERKFSDEKALREAAEAKLKTLRRKIRALRGESIPTETDGTKENELTLTRRNSDEGSSEHANDVLPIGSTDSVSIDGEKSLSSNARAVSPPPGGASSRRPSATGARSPTVDTRSNHHAPASPTQESKVYSAPGSKSSSIDGATTSPHRDHHGRPPLPMPAALHMAPVLSQKKGMSTPNTSSTMSDSGLIDGGPLKHARSISAGNTGPVPRDTPQKGRSADVLDALTMSTDAIEALSAPIPIPPPLVQPKLVVSNNAKQDHNPPRLTPTDFDPHVPVVPNGSEPYLRQNATIFDPHSRTVPSDFDPHAPILPTSSNQPHDRGSELAPSSGASPMMATSQHQCADQMFGFVGTAMDPRNELNYSSQPAVQFHAQNSIGASHIFVELPQSSLQLTGSFQETQQPVLVVSQSTMPGISNTDTSQGARNNNSQFIIDQAMNPHGLPNFLGQTIDPQQVQWNNTVVQSTWMQTPGTQNELLQVQQPITSAQGGVSSFGYQEPDPFDEILRRQTSTP